MNQLERLAKLDELETNIGQTFSWVEPLPEDSCLIIKDEAANPGGSHYDRVYARLLRGFIRRFPQRDKVLELSSGSAGISLARLCQELSIHARLLMPESRFTNRAQLAKALGAEVILTPAAEGIDGTSQALQKRWRSDLRTEERVFLNHSHRDESVAAMHPVAQEVMEAHGPVDYFFSALGNGTSLRGIAEPLLKANPETQIIGVRYLPQTEDDHIPGTDQTNIDFPHLEAVKLDDTAWIDQADIHNYAKAHNLGLSSTMVKLAAQRYLAKQKIKQKVALVLNYDKAERY